MRTLAGSIPRAAAQEAALVVIPVVHAAALLSYPSIPLIAIGLWWTSNTCAHNFIHRPFFRAPTTNAAFSLLLTAVMGVPQQLWRERHLAHHADRAWRLHWGTQLAAEGGVLAALWAVLWHVDAAFLASVYLPGLAGGLALCAIQGHYEHAGGPTSHYGRLYNLVCFNDGYHVEHHAAPGVHWTMLPRRLAPSARTSRWPPLLRWLDALNLDALERLVLHSRVLQRLVLHAHRRAFARLLPALPPVGRVVIVGGGLFPRTALILRELLPSARIVIVDASPDNLQLARARVGPGIDCELWRYRCGDDLHAAGGPCDLLVIPLAFDGDREAIYQRPPARAVIVHDWIWRPRGATSVVSPALFKRINLVTAGT